MKGFKEFHIILQSLHVTRDEAGSDEAGSDEASDALLRHKHSDRQSSDRNTIFTCHHLVGATVAYSFTSPLPADLQSNNEQRLRAFSSVFGLH